LYLYLYTHLYSCSWPNAFGPIERRASGSWCCQKAMSSWWKRLVSAYWVSCWRRRHDPP